MSTLTSCPSVRYDTVRKPEDGALEKVEQVLVRLSHDLIGKGNSAHSQADDGPKAAIERNGTERGDRVSG